MDFYKLDSLSSQAKEEAQRLSFSPVAFHAAKSLRDLGILEALNRYKKDGTTAENIAETLQIDVYGIKVLLDMGLSAGLVIGEHNHYKITKLGQFVNHDAMTRVNMDFVADICYRGLAHLSESILEKRPAGLKTLGNWATVYEGLSQLDDQEKASWFNFDHYYSDRSFPVILDKVFSGHGDSICDIGANTGKWTLKCCEFNPNINVTMVDLPQQLDIAYQNICDQNLQDRVSTHPCNLLKIDTELPNNHDIYWMSQFLDCFSEIEIVSILSRVCAAMKDSSDVYILELFPDRQDFESACYTLNGTSLYFTAIANGNSRFYMSYDFLPLIEKAGLHVVSIEDHIGLGHSLIHCRKIQ
ncbi:methyltransferase [Vibrio taketomensis]|uniref:methyltransferase n=1 Tax=Vibrio taketomensis TaxID=2572923 RepID=UPI00138A1FD0|nr:class I SAM-dependent methyltransferase [Vibrio taketomensis]